MVFLKDFAKERNVNTDALTAYIRRHKEDFKGHTKTKDKKMEIDETAYELLDKIYPLPRPIEIVEDKETRQKLMRLQEAYIELQRKYTEQQIQLAQAESIKVLLEDKTSQLKDAREEINQLKEQNDLLQEKYETELRKTWWDKLRGK